jgi:hypothetical protein
MVQGHGLSCEPVENTPKLIATILNFIKLARLVLEP